MLRKQGRPKSNPPLDLCMKMTLLQNVFCPVFDGLCQNKFARCVLNWDDDGKGLVLHEHEDLEQFLWVAENVAFPLQWCIISGMRELNESHTHKKERIEWKRRQVFVTLLQHSTSESRPIELVGPDSEHGQF